MGDLETHSVFQKLGIYMFYGWTKEMHNLQIHLKTIYRDWSNSLRRSNEFFPVIYCFKHRLVVFRVRF